MQKLFLVLIIISMAITAHTQTDSTLQSTLDRAVEPQRAEMGEKIFTKPEVEAAFPGGEMAWVRYLQSNLDANTAAKNGAPKGTYTVMVKFIVAKDGGVSDIVAETNNGYGMEIEVIRIIKKGPRWTPAIQNGRNVASYRRQPVTFVVQ